MVDFYITVGIAHCYSHVERRTGGLVKVEVKHSYTEDRIIDQFVEQEEISVVRENFWEELQIIPTCLR